MMQSAGRKGGHSATELDPRPRREQLRSGPLLRRLTVAAAREAADRDLAELEERMRKNMLPRPAAPPWSAPVPIWRTRLASQIAVARGEGIGYQVELPSMRHLNTLLRQRFTLICAHAATPLAWSRSRAADIGRIIHVTCPVGKAYASMLVARSEREKAPPVDFGFAATRSREGGAAAVAERAARYGLTTIASFKNLSKASSDRRRRTRGRAWAS